MVLYMIISSNSKSEGMGNAVDEKKSIENAQPLLNLW